jgi:P27 family predicted phage terminase small subunit
MTGRRNIPTDLKVLRMTSGKAKALLAKRVPTPGPLLEAPDWFTEEQKADWQYAIENAPRDVLKRIDKAVLAGFIVALDVHRKATLAHQQNKMLIKTPQGLPMQNPYLPIMNRQYMLMLRAASELGFTPCSRARIDAGNPPASAPVGDWEDVETA